MATSLDTIIGLGNLMQAIKGTSSTATTSGGTTTQTSTTKKDVDQVGVDRTIQKMLSGQGGQAAISGAARGAGLYNSTAERQLLNDLDARVAGEVANITAPTTNTSVTTTPAQTVTQATPGIGLGSLIAPLALSSIAKPALEKVLGLGAASGAAALGDIIASPNVAASLGSNIGSGGAALTGATDFGNMLDFGGNAGGGVGVMGNVLGSASTYLPFLGPLLGGGKTEDYLMAGGTAALTSILAATPLAPIAPLVGIIGSLFGKGGLSVVCTALIKRGLLSPEQYAAGQAYLQTLPYYTLKGYYFWGEPLAAKIAAGNKWAIRLALPFAKQRTALLAGGSAWKNPLGVLTKYVGQPLCYALGWGLTKFRSESNGLIASYQAR